MHDMRSWRINWGTVLHLRIKKCKILLDPIIRKSICQDPIDPHVMLLTLKLLEIGYKTDDDKRLYAKIEHLIPNTFQIIKS